MTSDKKPETGARTRSGPRTPAGRARSARNALRHGLTVSRPEAAANKEAEAFARTIIDAGGSAEIVERARRVARAQLDLARVRCARRLVLLEVICPPGQDQAEAPSPPTGAEAAHAFADRLMARARNLRALDRYERAAAARRRFAIHALDEARRRDPEAARRKPRWSD